MLSWIGTSLSVVGIAWLTRWSVLTTRSSALPLAARVRRRAALARMMLQGIGLCTVGTVFQLIAATSAWQYYFYGAFLVLFWPWMYWANVRLRRKNIQLAVEIEATDARLLALAKTDADMKDFIRVVMPELFKD